MNTVLLNTVHLDGAPIIKKVSGEGGGSTILNQSKSVEITENGSVSVTPDAGYTGLSKVDVNVDVPTQEINNQDKAIDIVENGTTEIVADAGYTGLGKVSVNVNVASSGGGGTTPSRPSWTGHADVEGLKAIGWTDEDIAYYQENGVNWNEEDDEYHKVTDDNKALYGVLTASNIQTYKDRIVYLPKIDTSGVTSMNSMFSGCQSLVSIPLLDTSNVTNMGDMFYYCSSLVSIPQLDTSNVTRMKGMFQSCISLISIPQLDTSNATSMNQMFFRCYSLVSTPQLDASKVTDMSEMFKECYSLTSISQLNTNSVTDMNNMFRDCRSLISIPQLNMSNTNIRNMFYNCSSLVSIPQLDTSNVNWIGDMFYGCSSLISIPLLDISSVAESMTTVFKGCRSLTHINIKNTSFAHQFNSSALLSKESLLYLINNEAATSAITITLAPYAYERLANDADVVEALTNHPNITLASAS